MLQKTDACLETLLFPVVPTDGCFVFSSSARLLSFVSVFLFFLTRHKLVNFVLFDALFFFLVRDETVEFYDCFFFFFVRCKPAGFVLFDALFVFV